MPFRLRSPKCFAQILGCLVTALLLAGALSVFEASGASAAGAVTSSASHAPLLLRALRPAPSRRSAGHPGTGAHTASASSQPLTPGQLSAAYGLPVRGAPGQTIAIVSAFDDPTLQSDMAAYDRHFHLPPCTSQNGCLRKLNQEGHASPVPQTDTGGTWITESALGTEVAHSLCQSCRILLVESDFPDVSDFSVAARTAAHAGAGIVVSTFTPPEDPTENYAAPDYAAPHTAFVAATGDNGYSGALSFPAALPTVIAAGGTNLSLSGTGAYGRETAWNGTGSGCSIYETAPKWQARRAKTDGCGTDRAASDVSADSAPGTIIYVSNVNGTKGGALYQAEGTSVSAPIIGAIIGLAGSRGQSEAPMLYARELSDPSGFHDVTSGNDASGCTSMICKAGPGWDGPTGVGTPAGLEAFLPGGPSVAPGHPRLTIPAAGRPVRVRRGWKVSLGLVNGNPFRINAQITLRRTLSVGGHPRTITLASGKLPLASLQKQTLPLTIAGAARGLLSHSRRLTVWVFVRLRGETGPAATVKRQLTLIGPRG